MKKRVSKSAKSAAKKKYTALHEGLPPKSVKAVPAPRMPKYGVELGRLEAVEYRKRRRASSGSKKGRVTERSYRHEFDPDAEPILWHDDRGELHIKDGKYAVTERGIVDFENKKMKHSNPFADPFAADRNQRRAYERARAEERQRRRAMGEAIGVRRVDPEEPKEKKPMAVMDVFGGPHQYHAADFLKTIGKVGGAATVYTLIGTAVVNKVDMRQENRGMALLLGGIIGGAAIASRAPVIGSGMAIGGLVSGAMVMGGLLRSRSLQGQLGGGLQGLGSQPRQQISPGMQPMGQPQQTSTPTGSSQSSQNLW